MEDRRIEAFFSVPLIILASMVLGTAILTLTVLTWSSTAENTPTTTKASVFSTVQHCTSKDAMLATGA